MASITVKLCLGMCLRSRNMPEKIGYISRLDKDFLTMNHVHQPVQYNVLYKDLQDNYQVVCFTNR